MCSFAKQMVQVANLNLRELNSRLNLLTNYNVS